MAAIDDLLARIDDPALMAALEREIEPLRKAQSLGLVFERHLPEIVRLPKAPVRQRSTVQIIGDDEQHSWRVRRVSEGTADLRRRGSDGQVVTAQHPVGSLIVVQQFGEPIYPGLESQGRIVSGGANPFHSVIKADNFHALEALLFTSEGTVDAIFIDPPYNTGARDWKYNNDYVDGDDKYRHSKWLAMMDRRLRLAKRLLRRERSVLIVTIDENEAHRLNLLLEDIFPSSKIQVVTVMMNPPGKKIIDQFSRVDEYIFFIHIGEAMPARTSADTTPGKSKGWDEEGNIKPFEWTYLQRRGGNSRREDTAAKFFPVYINEAKTEIAGCGDHVVAGVRREDAEDPPPGCVAQWPIKDNGDEACWQLSAPTLRRYLKEGRVRLSDTKRKGKWGLSYLTKGDMKALEDGELVVTGKDSRGALTVERAPDTDPLVVGKTMWTNDAYNFREKGTVLLSRFLPDRSFPYPKSLYFVEDALRFYVGANRSATVLDFFAGSGTTAHAVMRLNKEDGGDRVSISVTNNEVSETEAKVLTAAGFGPGDQEWEARGIFEQFTRPRIEAAVTGVSSLGEKVEGEYDYAANFPMADGFDENVEFFELTYEDRDLVKLGMSFDAVAPLLWLKAGAIGPRVDTISGPWAMPKGGRYGVLFNGDSWREFTDAVRAESEVRLAFIVTSSESLFQEVASDLPSTVSPVRLYDSFLEAFELNTLGAT
jgi:adenine-specific DNA-methyltransferase